MNPIIELKDFQNMLEIAIEKVFVKYGIVREGDKIEPRHVTIEELCDHLEVSKQTIYNWKKDPKMSFLILPYCKHMGRNVLYDIETITSGIKRYGNLLKRKAR